MNNMSLDPKDWSIVELTAAIGRSGLGSQEHTRLTAELSRRQFVGARRDRRIAIAAAVISALSALAAWIAVIKHP